MVHNTRERWLGDYKITRWIEIKIDLLDIVKILLKSSNRKWLVLKTKNVSLNFVPNEQPYPSGNTVKEILNLVFTTIQTTQKNTNDLKKNSWFWEEKNPFFPILSCEYVSMHKVLFLLRILAHRPLPRIGWNRSFQFFEWGLHFQIMCSCNWMFSPPR